MPGSEGFSVGSPNGYRGAKDPFWKSMPVIATFGGQGHDFPSKHLRGNQVTLEWFHWGLGRYHLKTLSHPLFVNPSGTPVNPRFLNPS